MEQTYSYQILPSNEAIAIIKLGVNVLGGSDALSFTSLLNEISSTTVKNVILDLSAVEMMNSSGLGMLVSGLSTLKKYDIGLSLTSLPKKVENLLKMTHLDTIFKIYPSLDEALKST